MKPFSSAVCLSAFRVSLRTFSLLLLLLLLLHLPVCGVPASTSLSPWAEVSSPSHPFVSVSSDSFFLIACPFKHEFCILSMSVFSVILLPLGNGNESHLKIFHCAFLLCFCLNLPIPENGILIFQISLNLSLKSKFCGFDILKTVQLVGLKVHSLICFCEFLNMLYQKL